MQEQEKSWERWDYIGLEENCIFSDATSFIMKTHPEGENYKLSPQANLVVRFLLLKVPRDLVARILAVHYHRVYKEQPNKAEEMVNEVIRELASLKLIKEASAPDPPMSPAFEKLDTVLNITACRTAWPWISPIPKSWIS